MTTADATDDDRRALAWFDELAALEPAARARRLADIAAEAPALHPRLLAMLSTLDSDASRELLTPLAPCNGGRHAAGDAIAGYRLVRELGQGGMSEVWLAEREDGQVKRPVALKLPLALGGVLAERFARERNVLVALDHPHIARLYDAGVDAAGRPFIALEFVPGRPITAHAAGLPQAQRLALALQMLEAVDHAHRHMVVHRDLKPSNVLVDDQGQVKLLDFGIAKLLGPDGERSALTQDLSQLMTPRYAAPEQVAGGPISAATDVYAAGVLIYELLTGRLPYGGPEATLTQTLHAVVHEPPAPAGLGADLDAVLARALAKAPEQRYASAERLADDLQRYLAHRPVAARRVPLAGRARLWLRRNRGLAWGSGLTGLALVGLGALAVQQNFAARAQAERGDAVRDFLFKAVADAEPVQGQQDVRAADLIATAVERARREFADQPRLRGELLGELGRVQSRLLQLRPAEATLAEAMGLLDAQAPAADPARNRAKAYMALTLLWGDKAAKLRGQALASQALAGCGTPEAGCGQVRVQAHYALASIASHLGENEQAYAQARAMRDEAQRWADAPGRIGALETLASTARNLGRFEDGAAAVREALQLAEGQQLRAVNRHRLSMLGAALDSDLGRYAQAADALRALDQPGKTPTERSLVLRLAAQAEWNAVRPAAALDMARRAWAALPEDAIATERAFVQQALATALALGGEHEAARAALAQAQAGMRQAGIPATSPLQLRLRRLEGELLLRRGDAAGALPLMQALVAEEAALKLAPLERVRALGWLGCSLSLLGRGEAALPPLQEVVTLTAGQLPAGHPRVLRAELARDWARGGDGRATLARLLASLPADSRWQRQPPSRCSEL
jgi:eukaryotic-like serine/threonine-protein kinase